MCAILLAALIAWTPAGIPTERVFEVAAHPTLPGIAFVASESGVYRTTDAGSHWQHVTGLDLIAFAFNPFRASEVCALEDGLRTGRVGKGYCSADLGVTWTPMANAGINFLFFDRRVPDRMYAGVGYGNQWIYVSDDHGQTWRINGYLAGTPHFHGWGGTDADSNLYVTSWPHGGSAYYYFYWAQPVYHSSDGGNSWQAIDGEPDRWTVANDATLYYVLANVVRASTDRGATWTTRGQVPLSAVFSLAADPASSATLYAGGDGGSVVQSLDGGRSWKRIDDGRTGERVGQLSVGIDGTLYTAMMDAVFSARVVGRRHSVGRR